MSFEVLSCGYEDVLPFWKTQLWPGRESPITPASAIDSQGGLTLRIESLRPVFFRATAAGKSVGVNSGFQTSPTEFRSRGIWVDPRFRRQNIGKSLLAAVEDQARKAGCRSLWSMPRQSALDFYLRFGFEVAGKTEKYEFGPHFLVRKDLAKE